MNVPARVVRVGAATDGADGRTPLPVAEGDTVYCRDVASAARVGSRVGEAEGKVSPRLRRPVRAISTTAAPRKMRNPHRRARLDILDDLFFCGSTDDSPGLATTGRDYTSPRAGPMGSMQGECQQGGARRVFPIGGCRGRRLAGGRPWAAVRAEPGTPSSATALTAQASQRLPPPPSPPLRGAGRLRPAAREPGGGGRSIPPNPSSPA